MATRRKARKATPRRKPTATSALRRALAERDEALKFQAATQEILASIRSSVTDAQPVFDAIVNNVLSLFGTRYAAVFLIRDGQLHLAGVNVVREMREARKQFRDSFPQPIDYHTFTGKALRSGKVSQLVPVIGNPQSTPQAEALARTFRYDCLVVAPLVREGQVIGAIGTAHPEARRFDDKELAQLTAFADQAVIAIENARLFNETKEALEKQTATADILQVLSGSPSDTQPVFDAIVRHAARLCESSYANVFRYDGERIHLAASEGGSTEALDALRASYPAPPNPSRAVGRAIETGRVVHVEDTLADAQYDKGFAGKLRLRRLLAVPLLRGGQSAGAITVGWAEPGPIAQRHEHLLKTFADQAVIAIENVRLFNETREALERQTATAEILKVIASSPSDVQPVFDAIVRSAGRLAEGASVNVSRLAGDRLHLAAYTRVSPAADELLRNLYPFRIANSPQIAEAIRTGTASFVADFETDPRVVPRSREVMKARGFRSTLYVPLVSGGTVHGLLHVSRVEPGPFPEQWMRLFQTFADQAVIAIENVRLFNETKEALERQTAISEILEQIAGSPTDVAPVLQAVAERAARLCEAEQTTVLMVEGDMLKPMVTYSRDEGPLPNPATIVRLDRGYVAGRAALDGAVVNVDDAVARLDEFPLTRENQKRLGYRSFLAAPMMRQGRAIGVIAVWRRAVRPFSDKHEALTRTFADQAAIAIENVRLFNETKEALEQQTATSEILKVIRGSATDIQPVFDALAANAARLCEANDAILQIREADALRFVAHFGDIPNLPPGGLRPLSRDMVTGRAVLEGRQIHVADLQSEEKEFPQGRVVAKEFGYRTILATPLMREGAAIGAIMIRRKEARPFSEKHLALVKTFADQAVIAIENVRLFNETKEALEQQKASAEVLGAISGSIADTKPVFEKILASCERLFEGELVGITLADGDTVRLAAYHGPQGEQLKKVYPLPLTRESGTGWAILNAKIAHFPDIEGAGVPPGVVTGCRTLGVRAIVFAPMLFEGKGIGAIWVARAQPGAFTDKQLAQLRSFADQAVIAIQNARLVNETKEALERQTATADILRVISSSPSDVRPVFDAIVESAMRLIGGFSAAVTRFDGKALELEAFVSMSSASDASLRNLFPMRVEDAGPIGEAIRSRAPTQVADMLTDARTSAAVRESSKKRGYRSIVHIPMTREGVVIGLIHVSRVAPGAFSDHHVGLLKTFADQAVIAIENVRLFNETREALERQTATAEILKVIAGSPSDVQPVFDAIVDSALRLMRGATAHVTRLEGDNLHLVAYSKTDASGIEALKRIYPMAVSGTLAADVLASRKPLVVTDAENDERISEMIRAATRARGVRSFVVMPMVSKGASVGTIVVNRKHAGPFTDHELDLLTTFADQAVIAIENVRLFNETKEALDQQKASADVLSVISSSIADTKPVFDKILESCQRLFTGKLVGITLLGDDGKVHLAAYDGPGREQFEAVFPLPLDRNSGSGLAILEKRVLHFPDVDADGVPEGARRGQRATGSKAALFAPMVWQDRAIGVVFVARGYVGVFSDKEIALLKTFADQAVIAIQNARLFREIQEKSAQLEVANKHKSDFLANMSHELRTPLNAIIGFSEVLSDRMFGEVNEKQAEYLKDIHESGRHLLSLINDILDLSKIEAGRMELELSSFDLPGAVSNAMTLVRERAQRHGIQLGLEMDPGIGEFQADERKVKQILLNLLSNAVKFTPDGGRVDVSAKAMNGKIEIAVRDTGIGIAPEDHAAVFEEFKQVGRDYTRKAEGTGLGLALTRRLVELHGGEIGLESAPGKGSTFTVKLPLR